MFTAFIGFVIAGFALVGIAENSPMIPLMGTHQALFISWHLIQAGAVVALLAIVVGGAPLALIVLKQAFKVDRRLLRYPLVPVISFVLWAAYLGFIFLAGSGRIFLPGVMRVVAPGVFPAGNRL